MVQEESTEIQQITAEIHDVPPQIIKPDKENEETRNSRKRKVSTGNLGI